MPAPCQTSGSRDDLDDSPVTSSPAPQQLLFFLHQLNGIRGETRHRSRAFIKNSGLMDEQRDGVALVTSLTYVEKATGGFDGACVCVLHLSL